MLLLCGKTASGKNVIRKELLNREMVPLISYTTKPKRDDEKDMTDYYFVTDEKFEELKASGVFACTTEHRLSDEVVWKYALPKFPSTSPKAVAIVSPAELKQLKVEYPDQTFVSIYLVCDEGIIWNRLRERGDDSVVARQRINADDKDFEDILSYVDITIRNQDIDIKSAAELVWINYMYYFHARGRNYEDLYSRK